MKKIFVFFFIFFIVINICINTYAKYIFDNTYLAANINIDGEPPKIEFLKVTNTNEKYEKYANKTHTITIEFRLKEKNIKTNKIEDYITVYHDETPFYPRGYKFIEEKRTGEYIYYKYILSNLTSNGILKIKIGKGAVVDTSGQINESVILDTGITLDNIPPALSFTQEKIENGKINAKIEANEKIREINGWNLTGEKTLNKEFSCNVLYPLPVTDLAGNTTTLDVKIDKATNIIFRYGSMSESPENDWQMGNGLNQIAGQKIIEKDRNIKIECLCFYWEGLDKNAIELNAYAHTYWGEGKQGRCYIHETRYKHGYNPGKNQYATLGNGDIVMADGYYSLLLGGAGMNVAGNPGIGGKPIPEDIAEEHPFGISAISAKLRDTSSEYSVVYQIWVESEGWSEPASDGEEVTVAHDKPMGAYRMSLIPKTEKQYLIDLWKKDVGSNNMK